MSCGWWDCGCVCWGRRCSSCLLCESALICALSPHSLRKDAHPMFPNLQPGPSDAAGHCHSRPFLSTFQHAGDQVAPRLGALEHAEVDPILEAAGRAVPLELDE